MKIAACLTIALASGSLYARGIVAKASEEPPVSRTSTTVAGGEVVVRATPPVDGRAYIPGGGSAPSTPIVLTRDFKDSPPENLVRGEIEASNGEND